MSTPKLICKSAYISTQHYIDTLEYAGNKIDKQTIVYRDGSERALEDDRVFRLDEAERQQAKWVKIKFKEGHTRTISYERYLEITADSKNIVRTANIVSLQDDSSAFGISDGPHEMKDLDFYKYLSYIEGREGVEKDDGCGLFGLKGNTTIDGAKELAIEHEHSRKWSHIISMDTQDAINTGFDSRAMWQQLIVSKAPEIAKAYKISFNKLVIDCAYHGNTDNPHVHLLFYSKDATEGFIEGGTEGMNEATETLKSTLVNEIFKGETAELGKEKSALRKQMTDKLKAQMLTLDKSPVGDELQQKLEQLSVTLDTLSGSKEYGYLPAEVKLEVDELIRLTMSGTPQLAATFDEYTAVQEKFIARYIASPDKLAAKLDEWKQYFYHPRKSDMRQQHNIVVRAARELCAHRTAALRTFEGGNVDFATLEPLLSSEMFADDLPEQLPTTDDTVTDQSEWRTFEGGNVDFSTDSYNLSTEIEAYFTDEDIERFANRGEKIFRDSMRDIFNPKVAHTALQEHLLSQLETLRSSLHRDNMAECVTMRSEIHRLLAGTDADYSSNITHLTQDISTHVAKQCEYGYSAEFSASLNVSLVAGTSFLFTGMDSYAERLDDERYYQLLWAYKDLGDPLNRAIRKEIRKCMSESTDVQSTLHNLADAAEYLDNRQCQDYVREQIRELQGVMQGDEAYNDALSDYKQAFASVLHQHMPNGLGEKYTKRFNKTYNGVLRIMRPHYTYIQSARDLDKILCENIMRSDAVQKPLKQLLRKELDACLVDGGSFSAEWMRHELEKLGQSDSPEAASRIVAYMYQTTDNFRAKVNNQIGIMYQLQKDVVSPEYAAQFCDEYREQLLHGSYLPMHGSVAWYAKQLDENYYRVLVRTHKDCFKELNRDLHKGLFGALDDRQMVQKLRELHTLLEAKEPDEKTVAEAIRRMYTEIIGKEAIVAHIEAIGDRFHTAIDGIVDPNLALTLYERVRSDVHTGELSTANFIVSNFAAELEQNIAAAFLKQQLKHSAVKALRSEIYHAVSHAHTKDLPFLPRLELLALHANDPKNFDEILQLLSPEKGDSFVAKKVALYTTLFEKYRMEVDVPLDYAGFSSVMDTFFYGTDGNTMFLQETVANYSPSAMPFPTVLIAKSLCKDLLRCIASAAAQQQQTGSHDGDHAFAKQKQFKHTRFPNPEQFTEH